MQIGQSHEHGFDQPLGLMSDCHRRIEMFLGVLQRVATANAGGALPADHRQAMESALRYFASAAPMHTRDEEDSLFPRMRQMDDSQMAAILARVDRLEADHGVAERHHAEVDRLCRQWLDREGLSTQEVKRLNELLTNLKAAYQEHIQLEDDVVFPIAAQMLSSQALAEIGEEMAERRGLNGTINKFADWSNVG
jgi:hemerythrin-like domain-containing protein